MTPRMKTKRTVRNCKDDFKFVCPQLWEKLERTEQESVRFCTQCREQVHFCRTDEETVRHAQAGHCIAREQPESTEVTAVTVGRPAHPERPRRDEADEWNRREQGINKALADLKYAHRACPGCGYPWPDWTPTCRVCGREIGRV